MCGRLLTGATLLRKIQLRRCSSFRVLPVPRFVNQPNVPKRSSLELREMFLQYFLQHQHTFHPPSYLIAKQDEGSYFVNAGVNQFKPVILGDGLLLRQETLSDGSKSYVRIPAAVNSQRCIRMSGKHNDLDDVGWDNYHHTSFEMLGNWSFGSYYKKEMCAFMWEFLTKTLHLPIPQLYMTIFSGSKELGLEPDVESRDVWLKLGVKDNKMLSFGPSSNLWLMGPNGVGGVCTEVHFDLLGSSTASGSRCARCFVNTGSPEVVELWNSVFISHEVLPDGHLRLLKRRFVDTGMGLERLALCVQGVTSTYDTDLYAPIIAQLTALVRQNQSGPDYSGTPTVVWPPAMEADVNDNSALPCSLQTITVRKNGDTREGEFSERQLLFDVSYRIVADHLKTLLVALNEGLLPHRRDVGLKMRHLISRTLYHAKHKLGLNMQQIVSVLPTVEETLQMNLPQGGQLTWPHLLQRCSTVLHQEADAVLPSLDAHETIFTNTLKDLPFGSRIEADHVSNLLAQSPKLNFDFLGALSRYHGFTLTAEAEKQYQAIQDKSLTYRVVLSKPQIIISKRLSQLQLANTLHSRGIPATNDSWKYHYSLSPTGQYVFASQPAKVLAIIMQHEQIPVNEASAGQAVYVIMSDTNLYFESGGQASDEGFISSPADPTQPKAVISNLFKIKDGGFVVHVCNQLSQSLKVGENVLIHVNQERRVGLMQHHTATHLLIWSLYSELSSKNDWPLQLSSAVESNELKLTVSCLTPFDSTLLLQLEDRCQAVIDAQKPVTSRELNFIDAADMGAIYLKDCDYPTKVRVVQVEDVEPSSGCGQMCGGTHVSSTGHLTRFLITACQQSKQIVKELRAVAGKEAEQIFSHGKSLLHKADHLQKECKNRNYTTAYGILNELDEHLRTDLLGKHHRTVIEEILSRYRPSIVGSQRQSQVQQLLRDRSTVLTNIKCPIVKFNIENVMKAVRDILSNPPQSPVLFVDGRRSLLFVPKACEQSVEEVAEKLQRQLNALGENISQGALKSPKVDSSEVRVLQCNDGEIEDVTMKHEKLISQILQQNRRSAGTS